MATPIGHALAGYAVGRLWPGADRPHRPMVILAVAMANAPDLDFLPGLLVGMPAFYHQGITHSLGFAVAASLVAAVAFALRGQRFAAAFAVALLAWSSHLVLDALGPDARPPYGIPLLWPLSDEPVHVPVALLLGVRHAASATTSTLGWVAGLLDPHNLRSVALELVLLGPPAWWAWRRRRPGALGRLHARGGPVKGRKLEDRWG